MAKKLQLRRGTTSQHSSFTGAVGEVTVDTDKDSLVVHDGSTAGGHAIAKSSDVTAKVTKAGGDTLTGTHTYDSNGNVVINGSFDYNGSGNAVFTNLAVESDLWCTNQSGIMFFEPNNAAGDDEWMKIIAPDDITSSFTLKLPAADGTAGQQLKTDGSGNLSFSDATPLTADQTWTGSQRGNVSTATHSSGATYDFDMNAANNFKVTLSVTAELGFSNMTAGQSGTIEVVNGAFTPTFGSECHFVGGTVPSLTQSATSYLAYFAPSNSVVFVQTMLDVKAPS